MPLWLNKAQYAPVSNGDSDSSSRESPSFLDASSLRQNVGSIRFLWIHGVLGVFWIIAYSSLLFLSSRPHADTLSYPDLTSMHTKLLGIKEPPSHIILLKVLYTQPFHTAKCTSHQASRPTCQHTKANPTKPTARWDKLTHPGMVALTEQEHAKLPSNRSLFIDENTRESDPPLYVGAVEVFHQLHCLDMLRMQVYGVLKDWYDVHSPANEYTIPAHLEHCIDYIRQSIMCRPSLDICLSEQTLRVSCDLSLMELEHAQTLTKFVTGPSKEERAICHPSE
ncbi:hypothetical protein V8C34DRAFT_56849 [Trichoderma compactum]